jgi:hypothetical protein
MIRIGMEIGIPQDALCDGDVLVEMLRPGGGERSTVLA